jgi:hypothetical protein
MQSSSNTSGEKLPWFVVLMEDNHAVAAFTWDEWMDTLVSERPDNCYIVSAKDHLDAFMRANRGELVTY